MKNFAARLLLAFLFLAPVAAHAQSTGRVVADCTTGVPLAYGPGTTSMMTMLPTGAACVNASVVASIAGFAPATTGTPITATTSGVTGTLPAGAVVIATNVGTTNAAYCKLGASATTADQYLSPNGGWFAFTVGAATQLTCITSTSTTAVNMTGGAGIATGTGGGGGGSGGAVTQSGTWTVQPGNTANTTPWLVSVDNTNVNGQATMANSSPVAIASNQSPLTVVGGAADPCQTIANSTARGSIASATTTRIITPSASNKTYICSVDLLSFAANNVAVVEGTGGTCGSGTAGVIGGTTTGTGISFAAQGGLVKGGAGFFVWNTAGTNVDFCLITSTTGPLSYFVKYVQAP
jgi:hypothetical protein